MSGGSAVKPSASNDEVARGILEDIGCAPDKQEIHGAINIYTAAETGNLERVQSLIKMKGKSLPLYLMRKVTMRCTGQL